ncbi:hypothetical protein LEMLEM_LOCUS27860, partial [Lemmus lemmus]
MSVRVHWAVLMSVREHWAVLMNVRVHWAVLMSVHPRRYCLQGARALPSTASQAVLSAGGPCPPQHSIPGSTVCRKPVPSSTAS